MSQQGKTVDKLIEQLRNIQIQRRTALSLLQDQEDKIVEELRSLTVSNGLSGKQQQRKCQSAVEQAPKGICRADITKEDVSDPKNQTVKDFQPGDKVRITNKPTIFSGRYPTERDRLATVTHITGNRWVWFETESGERTCRLPKNLQKIESDSARW